MLSRRLGYYSKNLDHNLYLFLHNAVMYKKKKEKNESQTFTSLTTKNIGWRL